MQDGMVGVLAKEGSVDKGSDPSNPNLHDECF